ncbi:MAG: PEGA domain-containing protein, partial [Treponema sp.]|nr:PEGA domain-containing protein [Treponema sp.]
MTARPHKPKVLHCRSERALWSVFLCACVLFFLPQLLWPIDTSDIVGDTFEQTKGSGLAINTRPAGVRVFIDGVERGQTPFTIDTLRPGIYSIRLIRYGLRERLFNITLSNNSRMTVSIEMEAITGQVAVNVYPDDGSPPDLPLIPLIDGGQGESSDTILSLPVGLQTIRVRAFGWQDAVQTVIVSDSQTTRLNIPMKPALFAVSGARVNRRNFNPNNPGALGEANFSFSVSGPGTGTLVISDQHDHAVYSAALGPYGTWAQHLSWNGRDNSGAPLPEGRYNAVISSVPLAGADSDVTAREISFHVQIDYALSIYPLTLTGEGAGLLFSPVPASLPAGSFQFEILYLFGAFSVPEKAPANQNDTGFSVFPVNLGIRFSVLNQLEFGVTTNVNVAKEEDTGLGFSVFSKYVFLRNTGFFPSDMAAV